MDLRDTENSGTPCKIDSTYISSYNETNVSRSTEGALLSTSSYIQASGTQLEDGAVFIVFKNNMGQGEAQGLFDFGEESGGVWWNEVAGFIANTQQAYGFGLYGDDCGGFFPGGGGLGIDYTSGEIKLNDYLIGQYNFHLSESPDRLEYALKILGSSLTPNPGDILTTVKLNTTVSYDATSMNWGCIGDVDLPYADLSTMVFGSDISLANYSLESFVIAIFVYKAPQTIVGL